MKKCGVCGNGVESGVICHKECVDKVIQIVEQTEELDQKGVPWDKVYEMLYAYREGRLIELIPFEEGSNENPLVSFRHLGIDMDEHQGKCFILRPDSDPSARAALLEYAHHTGDEGLMFGIYSLLEEMEEEIVSDDDPDVVLEERVCRVCGCTQFNACPGGCYWVEHDLCSACATAEILKERNGEKR